MTFEERAYLVEDGIPLPRASRGGNPVSGRKGPETLAIERLEVGQSFLIDDYKASCTARQAGLMARPKRFTFRKVKGGWRVWRIE